MRVPGGAALNCWGGGAAETASSEKADGSLVTKVNLFYNGLWRHTQVILAPMWLPSSKTCHVCGTVNPDLKRERIWTCPDCGARHDRNLNAAINLRNLIMPAYRGRNGRAQDAVPKQTPRSSRHGEPGVVKDAPPLREGERGADAGTEAEGPARGRRASRNHRSLNAAIDPSNFVIPPGRRRDGRGQEVVIPGQGPLASSQGHPGSVPKRKDRSHLRGRRREPGEGIDLDKRRPWDPGIAESRPRQSA